MLSNNRHALFVILPLIALALVPPLAMWFDEPFVISMVNRVIIYGLAAMSLDLILGYGGMVSLGHAAFFGVGAYVAGILTHHAFDGSEVLLGIPGTNGALVVWPVAMLVAAVCAFVIGIISLRTSGVYFIMITLAFAQLLYFFFISLQRYGGEDGLSLFTRNELLGLDLNDRTTFYYVCFVLLLGVYLFLRRLIQSRFGRVLRGSKQNERRMRALGFSPLPYKLTAFCIAGAIAGLAGALIANQSEFVSPELLHWSRSGQLMVMVILGGLATLIGPIYGAAFLLLMEEILVSYTDHWQLFIGLLLVMVVIFFRGSIFGVLAGRRAP